MQTEAIDALIAAALKEDMPEGDITSESIVPLESRARADFVAKEAGILAGIEIAGRVFRAVEPTVDFEALCSDGAAVSPGDRLAKVGGPAVALLKGERTALNFLQRMSGIATATRQYVRALEGSRTRVLDTRKTTPGLRILEKYAVRMGGGTNHRFSLSDMVMIKDNHLRLIGSLVEAVKRARERVPRDIRIEVETSTLAEVGEALDADVDMIMLDNMSLEDMKKAVALVKGRVPLEVSGNVDLDRARKIASLGVDYISVGRLTHSFSSLDISLEFLF